MAVVAIDAAINITRVRMPRWYTSGTHRTAFASATG